MSTPAPQPSTGMQRLNIVAVGVVAVVAAVISYAHMQDLAHGAGEGWRSHLLPLSVDGLLVAATTSILVARWRSRPASWVAKVSLGLGIAASIAANIAAAEPTLTGRMVAAWPPLALALATELLAQQGGHRTSTETDSQDTSNDQGETPADPADAASAPAETPVTGAPAESPRAETDTAPAAVDHAPRADDTPRRATGDRRRAPRPASPGRTGNADAREKARAVFEQARAAGRADEVTGAQLAAASDVHPGTARKWLAAWRAETAYAPNLHSTDTTTDQHAEQTDPTRAEEVAA